MKLVLASKNPHKLREMKTILSQLGLDVVLEADVGIDVDVEETGTTFLENALLKAQAVMEASGMAAIADDSGLMVDALDGAPGIYSARYGHLDSDRARTAYLLKNMEHVPAGKRSARFISAIACVLPDGRTVTAQGICKGEILFAPQGDNGFGYDPVFYVPELGKTFSEADPNEKNAVSHRGRALQAFLKSWEESIHAE